MHVREVPRLVFEKLANDREEVVPAVVAQERYPVTFSRNSDAYSRQTHKIGQAATDVWLGLMDNPDTPITTLGVFSSYDSAALHPTTNAIAELSAGSRFTGGWSVDKGARVVSEVWVNFPRNRIELLDINALHVLTIIGKEALELVESGNIEYSVFGYNELIIESKETNQ